MKTGTHIQHPKLMTIVSMLACVIFSTQAFALSCVLYGTDDYIKAHDVIFTGKLLDHSTTTEDEISYKFSKPE